MSNNKNLTVEQKLVLFKEETEPPGSSKLNNEKRDKLFKVARNFRMNDTTDVKLEKMRQLF